MIAPYFFISLSSKDINDSSLQKKIFRSLEISPSLRKLGVLKLSWLYCLYPQEQVLEQTQQVLKIGLGQYLRRDGPWAIITIHQHEEVLHIERDPLGLLPFFSDVGNQRLSTEHFELVRCFDLKQLDTSAILNFFLWGQTFEQETFYQHIRKVPNGSNIEKSTHQDHFQIRENKQPQAHVLSINDAYLESLESLLSHQIIRYMTLTGGSDSRFNLYSLKPQDRDRLIFWFDTAIRTSKEELNAELAAICPIAEKFNLMLVYNYPELESYPKKHLEYRYTDIDIHQQTLTGLYGTEYMSGAFLNRYFQTGPLSMDWRKEIRAFLDQKDFDHYQDRFEKIRDFYHHYDNFSANDRLHVMLESQNSFATDLYQSPIWIHPWLQTHRKPTPYLGHKLLCALSELPQSEIKDYNVLIHLFNKYHPEALKFPLQSSMNFHLDQPLWASQFITTHYQTFNSSPSLMNPLDTNPSSELQLIIDLLDNLKNAIHPNAVKIFDWRKRIILQSFQN